MGKYLKLFNNKNEYNEFIDSSDYVLPNVSYIMELGDVKFNPDTAPVEPEVPSDICVTMKFEATEDNLLAFSQIPYNVTSITVDDQPFNFTPIETQKVVKYVTKENAFHSLENAIPDNTIEFYIETVNSDDKFDDNTYISVYSFYFDIGAEVYLKDFVLQGSMSYTENKIRMIMQIDGMVDGYTFICYTTDGKLIETKQTSIVRSESSELESPLTFATSGSHTVKLTLNDNTFFELSGLSESTLTDCELENVLYINPSAFKNCKLLANIKLGNKLKDIGAYSFENCINLNSIEIPSSVETIGYRAFCNCTNLSNIKLDCEKISFMTNVFERCTSLPVVDNIRYADNYIVGVTDTTLTEYNIKDGTKRIGYGAFDNCVNLTSITIPYSVTIIDDRAFEDCYQLTSLSR